MSSAVKTSLEEKSRDSSTPLGSTRNDKEIGSARYADHTSQRGGLSYLREAYNAAWYSGFLWYSTRRNPQVISVEKSLLFAFLSFRNFSTFPFSSGC